MPRPRIGAGGSVSAGLIQIRGKSPAASRPDEAAHPVRAGLAPEPAELDQVVEVGERLANGEGELMEVELAAEQDRDELGRRARLAAGLGRAREALVVVVRKLVQAELEPAEREAVGGQHEHRIG